MSRKNDSWGIEIGANAIKALRLQRRGSDVVVADYVYLPFKQVLTTPDLNVEATVQAKLDQLLSKYDLSKSTVMVSVAGNVAFAKFAKLPPVDPKKIPDMVRFEAVQQIPFPIEQVQWDYQVFSQLDSPDVEIGIFAITKERALRLVSCYEAVGLKIDGLTLSSLAVYNALAYDLSLNPNSPGYMFMDIGTAATDVIIVEDGNPWLRTFQIGGNNFTEALVRSFKLSFSKAEKLKREAGTSKYTRQIFQAMRPVFADLVQELQKTLGFYMSMNRDAKLTDLIGVGSTFRLPGLQKFLKQQLQMEVLKLNGFNRISVEGKQSADFIDRSLDLATAYGLALQGLELELVSANILPTHLVKQRVWRAKQPWMAAAAAVMLGASLAAWGKLAVDRTTYGRALQDSTERVDPIIQQAQQYQQSWGLIEKQLDPRQQIENLRHIMDYRDVWPGLIADISAAAGSLKPQGELMTLDYDKIREVPRATRRRLYISSIRTDYQPSQTPTPPLGKAAEGSTPPAFLITIEGYTPYREATKLISERLILWLKENRQRDDRPYRFEGLDKALARIRQITKDTRGPHSSSGNARRSGSMYDLDNWLPDRPLTDESRVGDWMFELQWTVRLLPPDEARHAQVVGQQATSHGPTADSSPMPEEHEASSHSPSPRPSKDAS